MTKYHRTLGTHVSESLWQTVQYQAMADGISVSTFVRIALIEHLDRRDVEVATYAQIVGQTALELHNRELESQDAE